MPQRFFILLAVVVATTSCQQTKTYTDKERGFEFDYPSDWTLDTLTSNPRVTSPKDDTKSRYAASFQILSEETQESLDSCFQFYVLDYFPQQVDQFEQIAQGRQNLSGYEAKWIEFQYQKMSGPKTALVYLTVSNGRVYQLEGLVDSGDYPKFKKNLSEMIIHFRLN